jgi:hypothetical protein
VSDVLTLRAVPALLAGLLILPVGAQAATTPKPGVFSGSLGVKVPKGGHARVRAIEAAGGVVVAAKDVSRSGVFSLRLPPGPYVVRGVVLPKRGAVITKSIAVSLKPGQRRRNAKLTARKKTTRRPSARAAYVTERGNVRLGKTAAGIYPFAGPSTATDLGAFATGFDALLVTDVIELVSKRCPGRVVLRETARLADALREFELGKSPYADKSTFPQRNVIVLDVAVRGTISKGSDGKPRVSLTITNDRTGVNLGAIDSTLGTDVFTGEERVARQLTDKLCELTEAFEVTLEVNGAGRFATHEATGTMHAVLTARRGGGSGAWTATGPLQWQNVAFTSKTDCTYADFIAPSVTWSVTITDASGGLTVAWGPQGNDSTTASVDCPGDPYDPPPIPGQPGPALINTGPASFPLPYAGGTTAISGGVQDGGDGFFNSGTITVKPIGITPPG